MKFSMIVPVYNVEDYLGRCMDSLMHQTYTDIEMILVDDGSTDHCPEMCDDYAKRDNRIKVIHQENGGLSDARNKGLKNAVGEYVLFVDSDDYIETDTCEKFARYTENGCDILLGDAFIEGGRWAEGVHSFLYTPAVLTDVIDGPTFLKKILRKEKALFYAWQSAYRREFLLKNQLAFQHGIFYEDLEFIPRAFLEANAVVCTRIPFYHYIRRENSITMQKDQSKNNADMLRVCSQLEARFRNMEDEELRCLLMDFLSSIALSRIASKKIYHYQDYIDKNFFRNTAYTRSNKWKSAMLCMNSRLYICVMDLNCRFKIKQRIVSMLKIFK